MDPTTPQVPVATPQGQVTTTEAPFVPAVAGTMPAFREIIADVPQVIKEIKAIKPGYKTTEFWLVLVFNVVSVGAVILPDNSSSSLIAGLLASALSLFGYSASRGMAKSV